MCIYEKSSTTQTVVFIWEKGIFWCILQSICDWDSTPCACGSDLYINGLLSPVSEVMKNGQVLCVLYNLSSENWLKQCWEWRNWETIFIWSAYYLCTYSECEGKSHCKYVLLCNLYCNYMNRCNNVALTIIIFGGKDRPLDKKKLGMELNLYIKVIVYTVIISMFLLLRYIFNAWWLCKSKAINRDNYF